MALPQSQAIDGNGRTIEWVGWDPVNNQFVVAQSAPGTPATGQQFSYGPMVVQQNAAQSVNGTLQSAQAGNANGTPLSLLGMASVILTVTMTGFTGTINFEVTEDNANFDPVQVQQEGLNLITTSIVGNVTTSTHVYEASVAGLQAIRARTSGVSAGSVTVTAHAIPVPDAPRAQNAVNTEGQRFTYRAAISGLAAVTGCTDLFTLTGAANKVVRVTRVEFSGTIATAAMYLDVLAIIRSTANTAGTKTNPTPVSFDSNDPTAAASVAAYTANPTLGNAVGTIRSDKALLALTGTPTLPDRLVWDFGNRPAKAPVLRSAGQVFAINLNAIAIANVTLIDIAIEWTEDLI